MLALPVSSLHICFVLPPSPNGLPWATTEPQVHAKPQAPSYCLKPHHRLTTSVGMHHVSRSTFMQLKHVAICSHFLDNNCNIM